MSVIKTLPDRHCWFERFGDLISEFQLAAVESTLAAVKSTQVLHRLAYSKEDSDCTVRALAVVCGVPYEDAYAAMAAVGRRPGKPGQLKMVEHAAARLGFDVTEIPKPGLTLRTATRAVKTMPGRYLFVTCDHIVGARDGVVIDGLRDSLARLTYALAVTTI